MVGQPTQETEHMMKKMWKKNSKAVSPVIATILMVAITVVLAAVLYVMVMGMSGGDEENAPTGVLGTPVVSGTNTTITITSISPATDITKLSIKVTGDAALTPLVAGGNFNDIGLDGKASEGDFITLVTATANIADGDTIYLVYEPTGDTIDSVIVNI